MSSTTVQCSCGASVQFTEAERKNRDIHCDQCGRVVVRSSKAAEGAQQGRTTLLD